MRPGVAKFKRLLVDPRGRGHGLGRTLLTRMFGDMADGGYTSVMFSSAKFLVHARALYESVGFVDMPLPVNLPDDPRKNVYFIQRSLISEQVLNRNDRNCCNDGAIARINRAETPA